MNKLQFKKFFSVPAIIFLGIYFVLLVLYSILASMGLYDLLLCDLLLIFVCNIIYGVSNYKKRFLFILFHLMIFVFLLSRPTIYMLRQTAWYTIFSTAVNVIALNCILLSLVALLIGNILVELSIESFQGKKIEFRGKIPHINTRVMAIVTFVVMIICALCFGFKELDALLFMRGKAYEAYFAEYQPRIPYLINFVAGLYDFSVFAFLATKPTKKVSYIVLGAYVLSGVPMLIIGLRNPFMLKAVFSFTYFVIRNREHLPNGKKWIGKFEKTMIVLSIPLVVLAMGVINYTRSGEEVDLNVTGIAVDFLFKQGTTYDTVLQGIAYESSLPGEARYFSFGPLYDNYVYGKVGNIVLGTDPDYIGTGNSFRSAYNSHSFAHAISYVVLGSNYIAGEGRGTSYLVENYVDFGYLGVFLVSFVLGGVLSFIWKAFGKHWIVSAAILGMIFNLSLMPRETTLYPVIDILGYHFIVFIIGIIALYGVVSVVKKRWKPILK